MSHKNLILVHKKAIFERAATRVTITTNALYGVYAAHSYRFFCKSDEEVKREESDEEDDGGA